MASYPAVIELRVDGVTQVTRVLDTIDKLDKALVSIKKTPLAIDAKNAIDGIRVLKTEVDKFAIGLSTGTKQLASTTAGLNAQATAFRTLAANVKIGGQAFKLYTQAAEQARQKTSLVGGLAEIKALQNLYGAGRTAPTQAFKGINELLKLGSTIPKNIASLQLYRSELQNVINVVDAGSADFFELARAIRAVDMQLDSLQEAQRGAGIGRQMASPIGGTPSMAGSPAARAARTKQLENVALGAGFPLLFGGGIGQVAGGILGSFVGTGFGGQIIGSALLGQVEQLVVNFNTISEATKNLNMNALKDSAIFINKELEITVQRLKEAGRIDEARKLVAEEIANQTGVLPDLAAKYNKNSTLLANTWNKFLAAAGGFATIISGPTVAALTTLLSGFTKILQYSNALASSIATWGLNILNRVINRFKFLRDIIDRIRNNTSDQSEEEQAARLQEVKDTLDANQKVRSSYLERFKTQQDNILLTRKLNGELLGDYIRQAELEKELIKNNEERYAVLRQIQDIRAKGGIAAGLISAADMSALENKLKDLENKKIEIQIQIKEEALKKFEEDIQRSADAATRNLDLQANAIQGRATVQQSEFDLMRSINDLQLQRLSFEEQLLNKAFEQTGSYDEQLQILARLEQIVYQRFKLNVANAKVERASAIAQLKSNIQLLKIDVQRQRVQQAAIQASVAEQRAKGVYNAAQDVALSKQQDAVNLAAQSVNYAIENAVVQERIANAVYAQKVEAAGFARNMELAALASRRQELSTNRTSRPEIQSAAGGGLGIPTSAFKPMARGGYVTRPTFALVGEGGEPEFVVPQSKASAFAENWMAGRRGAEAIPRMAGSASNAPPSINITTGPVMQQEGTKYVTLADMESAMQSMASAMLGSNRSYSGRRYQGVR